MISKKNYSIEKKPQTCNFEALFVIDFISETWNDIEWNRL